MKRLSLLMLSFALLALSQHSFAATLTVTTTTDEITTNDKCSLREAVININNGTDSYADCANTSTEPYATNDTIQLEGKTYCLSLSGSGTDTEFLGDLDIKKAVTISGQSQSSTLIDAGNRPTSSGETSTCATVLKDRVLQVDSGITDGVTLRNLTITGGLAQTSDENVTHASTYYYYGAGIYTQSDVTLESVTVSNNAFKIPTDTTYYYMSRGGGIYSRGSSLSIANSTISGNSSEDGGGIYAWSTLDITNSTISGNSAENGGGGIYIYTYSLTLDITNSTISENSAVEYCGGIYANGSTINIASSTISGNSSDTGGGVCAIRSTLNMTDTHVFKNSASRGGGIYGSSFDKTTLDITNSTISENSAAYDGGGIYISDSSKMLNITNSTISDNSAGSEGGGMYARDLMLSITSSTISGNSSDNEGGGIYNYQYVSSSKLFRSTINLKNSILAGNTAIKSGDECLEETTSTPYTTTNEGEGFVSYGYNWIGKDAGCSLTPTANLGTDTLDQSFTSLKLNFLADNGGATQTQSLAVSSPAIGVASCTDIDGNRIITDQRGYLRPTEACDIGAYERGATIPTDNDGDGFYSEVDDCDDSDSLINPSATETCTDTSDINCDGVINSQDATACPAETTGGETDASPSDDDSSATATDSGATADDDSDATSSDDSSQTANDDSSATAADSGATADDNSQTADDNSATANDSGSTANDDNTPNPTESSSGGCSLTTVTKQSSVSGFMLIMLALGTLAITRRRFI